MVKTISDSQFHVWRVLIALALADGTVQENEKEWLSHCLKKLNLNDEQQAQLRADYQHPQDYKILCERITEKRDFVNLLHMAAIIMHIDGQVSAKEKTFLENIRLAYKGPAMNTQRELARATVTIDDAKAYWESWDPNDWYHRGRPWWSRRYISGGHVLYSCGGLLFEYPKVALILFILWVAFMLRYCPSEKLSADHFSKQNSSMITDKK